MAGRYVTGKHRQALSEIAESLAGGQDVAGRVAEIQEAAKRIEILEKTLEWIQLKEPRNPPPFVEKMTDAAFNALHLNILPEA